MTMNLSQYVGKPVKCELRSGKILVGVVEIRDNTNSNYKYRINDYFYNYSYTVDGIGLVNSQIIRITQMNQDFNGIAQKYPNINLDDFVNQTVMIVNRSGEKHITKLMKDSDLDDCYYTMKYNTSRKDGYSFENCNWDIMEIYGEGAYEVNTKSTFDEPEDKQIQEAKELLHKMNEEQIAKLLKSIQNNK